MSAQPAIAGAILAGGQSRRMGEDKAFLTLQPTMAMTEEEIAALSYGSDQQPEPQTYRLVVRLPTAVSAETRALELEAEETAAAEVLPSEPSGTQTAGSGSGNSGGTGGTGGSGGPNSCEGKCGQQAEGGCWCDTGCTQYSDCCQDYAAVCGGGSGGAGGSSGGSGGTSGSSGAPSGCTAQLCGTSDPGKENEKNCYCDEQCAGYGDCCSNKDAVCGN